MNDSSLFWITKLPRRHTMKQVQFSFEALVAAVNATQGKVMDDHGNGNGWIMASGIAVLVRGEKKFPVLLCNSRYFSLNAMYLGEDGEARVSRDSVGGVVELHGAPLADGIAAYNENQQDNFLCHSFLGNIHVMQDDVLVATGQVSDEEILAMQKVANDKYETWNNSRPAHPETPMVDTYRASEA